MSLFPAGRSYQCSPNPLAGFEGPLQGRERERKRKEGRDDKENEANYGGYTPQNKFHVKVMHCTMRL